MFIMMAARRVSGESRHYEMKPLDPPQRVPDVYTGGWKPSEGRDNLCMLLQRFSSRQQMRYIGWIVGKYGGLFKEYATGRPVTYHADILAYHVAVNYDPDNHFG